MEGGDGIADGIREHTIGGGSDWARVAGKVILGRRSVARFARRIARIPIKLVAAQHTRNGLAECCGGISDRKNIDEQPGDVG